MMFPDDSAGLSRAFEEEDDIPDFEMMASPAPHLSSSTNAGQRVADWKSRRTISNDARPRVIETLASPVLPLTSPALAGYRLPNLKSRGTLSNDARPISSDMLASPALSKTYSMPSIYQAADLKPCGAMSNDTHLLSYDELVPLGSNSIARPISREELRSHGRFLEAWTSQDYPIVAPTASIGSTTACFTSVSHSQPLKPYLGSQTFTPSLTLAQDNPTKQWASGYLSPEASAAASTPLGDSVSSFSASRNDGFTSYRRKLGDERITRGRG